MRGSCSRSWTRAGQQVLVVEARATVGGSSRSAALTLPGFVHDVCSTIRPYGIGSPFFRELPLARFGLEWIFPRWNWRTPWTTGGRC